MIPFVDLKAQQKGIRRQIDQNIETVLDHGRYIMGPEVPEIEQTLAEYCKSRHAIACASGTDALLMALMALNIGPGDAVFTTPFTFIATAEVIQLVGATPIFVDIDPATFNIDPQKLSKAIEALTNNNPDLYPLPPGIDVSGLNAKCIIAVDLFGIPAEYDAIADIASQNNMVVIEDAAQSFGAQSESRMACSFGDIACTSFFPAKPLGCYGDGGMCFTHNDAIADKLQSIRIHGKGRDKYDNIRIGVNGRMDTIQAAILKAKFDIFPEEIDNRQIIAKTYTDLIGAKSIDLVAPSVPQGTVSAWAQYSVLVADANVREKTIANLKDAGIPTAIYYPIPLHQQKAFEHLGYGAGAFPVSEACARRIFSLPFHPYLEPQQQREIIEALAVSIDQ